jgi:hypothetical protein
MVQEEEVAVRGMVHGPWSMVHGRLHGWWLLKFYLWFSIKYIKLISTPKLIFYNSTGTIFPVCI